MKANDKRIRAINQYAQELESKWERKDQIVSRWMPVVQTTRKHCYLNVEETYSRLVSRIKRCSLMISSSKSKTGCTAIVLTHRLGKFRLETFFVDLSTDGQDQFKRSYFLEHRSSQAVISRHAIERWLERNESDDVEAALFDLSKAMTESSIKMMVLKYGLDSSFDHLTEYEAKCLSGGMAIIKTDTPEDESILTREFTLVTYLSADQLRHWNRDEIDSELQEVNLEELRHECE